MDRFPQSNVIVRGCNLVTDTTAETKSAVADMEGFDELTFVIELEDVDAAAVLTLAVKENTANSTTSPTPTGITLTTESGLGAISSGNLVITESSGNLDQKTIVLNVAKNAISKRYIFLSITAATESYEVNSITIIKSRARNVPVTPASNVVAYAYAVS